MWASTMAPVIYLLEDDVSLRELLAEVLREELDAQLEACATMIELREHCARRTPDLIVQPEYGTIYTTSKRKNGMQHTWKRSSAIRLANSSSNRRSGSLPASSAQMMKFERFRQTGSR